MSDVVLCGVVNNRQRVLTSVAPSATVGHGQSVIGHLMSGDYDTSLLATVAVGCALLAVNVLVLLCVCYHRKVDSGFELLQASSSLSSSS